MGSTGRARDGLDRICASASALLVMSWAITDRYLLQHWWSPTYFVVAAAVLALLLTGARWAPWAALAIATLAGIDERLWRSVVPGSDVLPVVREAIQVLAAGLNPYTHHYVASVPEGSLAFTYPPGALLVYWPFAMLSGDLREVERYSGVLVVALLASLAWRAGPGRAALACALYGTFGLAALRAVDGSSETTLAVLVLLGVVLLTYGGTPTRWAARLYWASVLPLAAALAFKQLAWPVYAFIAFWLWRSAPAGRRHVASTVGLAIASSAPFLLWDPTAFVRLVVVAPFVPKPPWGLNLWATLHDLDPRIVAALDPIIGVVFLGIVGAVALRFVRRPARDLTGALAHGVGVLIVALFFARWTSSPYYTYAFALLCALFALAPLSDAGDRAPHNEEWARRADDEAETKAVIL